MEKQVQLLDCTLRDGGQGLEASFFSGIPELAFEEGVKTNIIKYLTDSNIEIIELGCMSINEDSRARFANYSGIEEVSKYIPKNRNLKPMYIALYIGPDTPEELIPEWNPNLVEGVRVILRYSELKKSLDYCEMLCKKGYKVFVQPMLTMRYTDEELEMLVERTNHMKAYAFYMVDSYGYMEPEDIERIFNLYDRKLDKEIRIGFHLHNNLSQAFSNTKSLLKINSKRQLIIDSCVTGMGQGAGNLQTELIAPYLNRTLKKKYDYNAILEVCDLVEGMIDIPQWGYSVMWAIPAEYRTAYKYSMLMRQRFKMKYSEINEIIKNMPDQFRQRYTEDNLNRILKYGDRYENS